MNETGVFPTQIMIEAPRVDKPLNIAAVSPFRDVNMKSAMVITLHLDSVVTIVVYIVL